VISAPPTGSFEHGTIWPSVDRLLAQADVDGIRAHKLGALASRRLRRLEQPVPASLAADERSATVAALVATAVLERVRAACDVPLVLIKGPEVATLYPERARGFTDVDLFAPDAANVHATLRRAGFEEVDDPELFRDHHHLRPLQWPSLALKVEIHLRPLWPPGVEPPPLAEIVAGAVPSRAGVDGIAAPNPTHHALIVAAHAWQHEPLHTLRDLIDVAALAAESSRSELDATARAWGIERLWGTTRDAAAAVLAGARPRAPVRIWGRHLAAVRERTVLENHLQRWLHGFAELPPHRALVAVADALRLEVLPEPGESWRDKLTRVAHAFRHPLTPLSAHSSAWPAARRWGRRFRR
jgi:hypothetical protein